MATGYIKTRCAACNREGPRDKFVWMAHLDFCRACMRSFVSNGWAVTHQGDWYASTPEGVRRFPGLEVVGACPRDGMPIYRRWVEGGIATPEACPNCLGREPDSELEARARSK